jgi:hypothetical protein
MSVENGSDNASAKSDPAAGGGAGLGLEAFGKAAKSCAR